jgi:predicted lipoprotein with Yx(FWY)xxD motif
MRIQTSLVVAASVAAMSSAYAAKPITNEPAPLASPPGITFQTIKVGEGVVVPGSSSSREGSQVVFATAKGMTLYFSDKDQPGKSLCVGECATVWPPVTATADAKNLGDWSVIARDDGSKQWAYRGKPLWHAASLRPADGMPLPLGISVQEVADANGQALVDERNMPLYAFDGDPTREQPSACAAEPCINKWVPFAAPQLAIPIGDFTIVNRPDGVKQWAYRGRALYTFNRDVEVGDATGRGIDKRMQVAVLVRYFMPANVAVRSNPQHGGILVTAEGKTLYARDQLQYMGLGNHGARGGAKPVPTIGTAIGATGCDGECLSSWQPLAAPADAQPWGNWSVLTRADGSKQWAYQSYGLYTFSGDKKAGDMNGHDAYDNFIVNDDTRKLAPANHRFGLYWRVATQ